MLRAGRLAVVLSALAGAGCGEPTAGELREAARSALDRGDYAEAATLCERSLLLAEVQADDALHWGVERMRLDALASQGRGADLVVAVQQGAAGRLAPRFDAALYARLARRLYEGGDLEHAIALVGLGTERFPERAADFDGVLKDLEDAARKAAEGGDGAALEQLQQIPYLSR